MFFVLNAFSPNMLPRTATVKFIEVSRGEASAIINKRDFVNAIGHESTAKLVGNLLYLELEANRIQVSLNKDDEGLIFTLTFRPEEGKIYDYMELCHLNDEGKIKIYYFKVIE